MRDYKLIIKNKNFVFLWLSQIFSQFTINILNFLFLLKLFSETGSTIATSLLWISYALPAIIIGPVASALVDMVDRKNILIITNFLQSAFVLIYALFFRSSLFMVFGIAIVYSFLNQFYIPAESATLPSTVKKDNYPTANSLFFLTQQGALICGFALAGIINKVFGFETSLLICSTFLFLAFLSVNFLSRTKIIDDLPKNFDKAFIKFFSRIYDGYIYIKDNKKILAPFLLLISMQAALAVVVVNVPLLTVEIFKKSPDISGLIVVVPAGIGAALAALTVPKAIKKGKPKRTIIENSFSILILSFFVIIFLISELSTSLRLIFGMSAIVAIGMAFVSIIIPSQTILQENTPIEYRGRVFGNFWFLVTVLSIFPVLFSGAISEIFGIRLFLFLLSGGCLTVLIFIKRKGTQFLLDGK